jgi:hypothetical protein
MTFQDPRTNLILILLLGMGLTYLGYGPFSLRKNPAAGVAFAVVGFLFRLAGPLLLVLIALLGLFAISMSR